MKNVSDNTAIQLISQILLYHPWKYGDCTEALAIAMFAYNLMVLFRQFILNSKIQNTLSTLRHKTFAIGAYFEKVNDKFILKLALHQKRREWFTGLWKNTNELKMPFFFSNA